MLIDVAIILILVLLNGFFAMAELAIVSARRSRLKRLADKRHKGARKALELAGDPTRFLSIVQLGVTLNSVLAGAFSTAALADPLGRYLDTIPWIAPQGPWLAMLITVSGITYISMVFGELLPKRIGLAYAETIALKVAGFMQGLARLVEPVIWGLRLSTEVMLKLFRLERSGTQSVTEEEVRSMIAEGAELGIFAPAERKMLEGVMRLADRTVRTIMTPRVDMIWLDVEDSAEEHVRTIHNSGYSRLPVGRNDLDDVQGIVHAKDMLNATFNGQSMPSVTAIMRPALIVPDTTTVLRLLDQFKQSGQHLAIVVDEYGSVEGLVSTTDVLETITGVLPEHGRESNSRPVQREDGSWLVDAMTPVDEVETLIGQQGLRDESEYHTLAGFVIDNLGRIPAAGDHFLWNGVRFEVVDMDARRVDKVLIVPPKDHEMESQPLVPPDNHP